MKFANFFIIFFYCTKRRCSQIKPQLKVEIEDGRLVIINKNIYKLGAINLVFKMF